MVKFKIIYVFYIVMMDIFNLIKMIIGVEKIKVIYWNNKRDTMKLFNG